MCAACGSVMPEGAVPAISAPSLHPGSYLLAPAGTASGVAGLPGARPRGAELPPAQSTHLYHTVKANL